MKHKTVYLQHLLQDATHTKLPIMGAMLAASTLSFAQGVDEELPEQGFEWVFSLGAGYSKSQPSLADESDNTISSLSYKPASETETSLLWDIQGSYTFSNRQTQLNFSLNELGLSHYFDNGLALSLGMDMNLFSDDEVVSDPYLTNASRPEQTAKSRSYSLSLEGLFDLPVAFEYNYSELKIDNDQAGASLVNAGGLYGITQAEMAFLRRSSRTHALSFSTELELSENLLIQPSIGYRIIDAKGKANSATGYDLGVNLEYLVNEQYSFSAGAMFSPTKYDRSHPVFNRLRKDDGVAYSLGMTIDGPLDFEDQQLSFSYEHIDQGSNIKFYDNTESTFGVVWSYSF